MYTICVAQNVRFEVKNATIFRPHPIMRRGTPPPQTPPLNVGKVQTFVIHPPPTSESWIRHCSNITYSSLLTMTVVQNLVRSNQPNVSHFVIQRQLLPLRRPEIPCRPSNGIPSERLYYKSKWFISHRHTDACVNLVLLTYLLTRRDNVVIELLELGGLTFPQTPVHETPSWLHDAGPCSFYTNRTLDLSRATDWFQFIR